MLSPSRTAFAVLTISWVPLVLGLASSPAPQASLAAADIVLVREGDVVREDLYVAAGRVIVDGTIEGDLVVLAGDLRLTGTVEGDVSGAVRSALLGGEVGGSVRLAAGELRADGRVGEDLVLAAGSVEMLGGVGRDLLAVAAELGLGGSVERDVRGWLGSFDLDGRVGRNVEVGVQRMTVGSGTRVAGDLVYTAPGEGRISAAAEVGGTLIHREPAPPNVRVRAGQRLSGVLAFLAFLATGLLLMLAAPGAFAAATVVAMERPAPSWLLGLASFLLLPLLALLAVGTVVGIPLGLLLVGLWTLGLLVGPVPALTAVGHRLLGARVSPYGAFLLGSVLWGMVLLLPLVGRIAYLLALFWGLGAWLSGMRMVRGGRLPGALPVGARDGTVETPGD